MPKKKYINFENLNRNDIWIVVFDLDGTVWDGKAFKEDCAKLKRITDKILVDNERVAIRLYPCVRKTLEILHNQPGVFLGIASWNVKGTEYCLKKLDIAKYFHKELKYIVSDEEVKKGVKMSGTDKHLMVQEIIRIVEEWTNEKVSYGHVIFTDDGKERYEEKVTQHPFNKARGVKFITAPGKGHRKDNDECGHLLEILNELKIDKNLLFS